MPQHLQTAGPAHPGQAAARRLFGEGKGPILQQLQGGQGGSRIEALVLAEHGQLQCLQAAAQTPVAEALSLRGNLALAVSGGPGPAPVPVRSESGCRGPVAGHTLFLADPGDHLQGSPVCSGGDHRCPGLDDARFFPGDGLHCVPEHRGVLKANVGNDTDVGLNHVGGVEAAAQARLQHHQVGRLRGKVKKGEDGDHLELGRLPQLGFATDLLYQRAHPLRQPHQFRRSDFLPVDRHAVGKGHQVGRSVQPDPVPGGLENARRHHRRRTFAVGAGQMQEAQGTVGVPQTPQQRGHTRQPRFHAEAADAVNPFQGLGILFVIRRVAGVHANLPPGFYFFFCYGSGIG